MSTGTAGVYELAVNQTLTLVLQRENGEVEVIRGTVYRVPQLAFPRRALLVEMRDVVDVAVP